jgi:putative tryptophan/tyrosine transport system substrate-binding protein
MRLIGLAVVLAVSLLLGPRAAEAQQATKLAHIGILSRSEPQPIEAFRDGLRNLGHIEGKTYTIEPRYGEGRTARLQELALDLARSQVDVIFAPHGAAAAAAKFAAPTIPVVFISADPIADGLVASFNRPGGNLTGFAAPLADLASKWLELLREALPGVRRVAVLFIPDVRGSLAQLDSVKAAARVMKVEILPVAVRSESDLEMAFANAKQQRAGAITQISSPLFGSHRVQMVALAAKHRLPAIYDDRNFTEVGGLMSYGPDLGLVFRRAATYVDKILKGAKPSDLPVEQPTKFELVINLKTAKALGLTIPQSLLLRADQIIE